VKTDGPLIVHFGFRTMNRPNHWFLQCALPVKPIDPT